MQKPSADAIHREIKLFESYLREKTTAPSTFGYALDMSEPKHAKTRVVIKDKRSEAPLQILDAEDFIAQTRMPKQLPINVAVRKYNDMQDFNKADLEFSLSKNGPWKVVREETEVVVESMSKIVPSKKNPGIVYEMSNVGANKYLTIWWESTESAIWQSVSAPVHRVTDFVKLAEQVLSGVDWAVDIAEAKKNQAKYMSKIEKFQNMITRAEDYPAKGKYIIKGMHEETEMCEHSWDRGGERCVKCGDKDWMESSEPKGKWASLAESHFGSLVEGDDQDRSDEVKRIIRKGLSSPNLEKTLNVNKRYFYIYSYADVSSGKGKKFGVGLFDPIKGFIRSGPHNSLKDAEYYASHYSRFNSFKDVEESKKPKNDLTESRKFLKGSILEGILSEGGPGSGGDYPTQKLKMPMSPFISVGTRKGIIKNMPFELEDVPLSSITHVAQSKFVPHKVRGLCKNPDAITKKPVCLLKVGDGEYHVMDGHHRFLAAQKRGIESLPAKVWTKHLEPKVDEPAPEAEPEANDAIAAFDLPVDDVSAEAEAAVVIDPPVEVPVDEIAVEDEVDLPASTPVAVELPVQTNPGVDPANADDIKVIAVPHDLFAALESIEAYGKSLSRLHEGPRKSGSAHVASDPLRTKHRAAKKALDDLEAKWKSLVDKGGSGDQVAVIRTQKAKAEKEVAALWAQIKKRAAKNESELRHVS